MQFALQTCANTRQTYCNTQPGPVEIGWNISPMANGTVKCTSASVKSSALYFGCSLIRPMTRYKL